MPHLHFIHVFDHSSFKEMREMILSEMADFDRSLHFFQMATFTFHKYNLVFSSTCIFIQSELIFWVKTSNSNCTISNLTVDIIIWKRALYLLIPSSAELHSD